MPADPDLLPQFRVDRGAFMLVLQLIAHDIDLMSVGAVPLRAGAIPFVLKGVNIYCAGMTSKGGSVDEKVPKDSYVVRTAAQHGAASG